MEIKVAQNAGFCFGVRRAASKLEELIEENKGGNGIFTLGEIIHNPDYMNELTKAGVRILDQDRWYDDIRAELEAGRDCRLLIRTHGIARSEKEKAAALAQEFPERLHVEDCTCPYVSKIHAIADRESGPETVFMVYGSADHPEVIGIVSHVSGKCFVFSSAEEAERTVMSFSEEDKKLRAVLVAQTTQRLSEWKKIREIIEKVYTNVSIFDTICSVTEKRQEEAESLAGECDAVVVIGGANSSNTVKLYEICKRICSRSYLIQNAGELHLIGDDVFRPDMKVGITAGASTPDRIIQEVRDIMSEEMVSEKTENFEELLESSLKTLNTGDTVVGKVISIKPNEIQLDLGTKVTGTIAIDQITDDPTAKLDEMFKIGDEVEAFVIRVSDVEGIAALSKKRVDSHKNWTRIVSAHESGEILEGKIVEAVKGGVIISLFSNKVFIPASHTGLKADEDLSQLVGTKQRVKIIEIKPEAHRAYASIRLVAREEKKAAEAKIWNEIEEGKTYTGVVRSLTSYGAFVDIGGVDGMVHNTELSWKRIKHPSEVVHVGDSIVVFVKAFDREKKRISLGYKRDEDNPWFLFNQKYAVGDIAEVKIVSFTPFGAFAEIVDGVDGLIHISQITDHKIGNPSEVLELGSMVTVKIIGIDQENCKVNLSIRALMEEEKEAAAEAASEEVQDYEEPVYSSDNPDESKYVSGKSEDAE